MRADKRSTLAKKKGISGPSPTSGQPHAHELSALPPPQEPCVSTGVVEGGCGTVIGRRLKNCGMNWSVDGTNAIIALRCSVQSNRFDDFRERGAV